MITRIHTICFWYVLNPLSDLYSHLNIWLPTHLLWLPQQVFPFLLKSTNIQSSSSLPPSFSSSPLYISTDPFLSSVDHIDFDISCCLLHHSYSSARHHSHILSYLHIFISSSSPMSIPSFLPQLSLVPLLLFYPMASVISFVDPSISTFRGDHRHAPTKTDHCL